jgi:hypothetical protein
MRRGVFSSARRRAGIVTATASAPATAVRRVMLIADDLDVRSDIPPSNALQIPVAVPNSFVARASISSFNQLSRPLAQDKFLYLACRRHRQRIHQFQTLRPI